jgi:hypothetical protein
VSKESGLEVQYLNKSGIRNESLVAELIKTRGEHSGIVCILSTMDGCNIYMPWHDKTGGKTF